ncbi:MAG: NADPH-dependent 7-cyano-7-deazaguanine reductase QueF [Pseudomonadota bacterium]
MSRLIEPSLLEHALLPDAHPDHPLADTLLGANIDPPQHYDEAAQVLQPISRARVRRFVGLPETYLGVDLWQCFEFSWLGPRGVPAVRYLELSIPADSPSLVESKSLKLYLNAFALSRFDSEAHVLRALNADLSAAFGVAVGVELQTLSQMAPIDRRLPGECIDDAAIEIQAFAPDAALLTPVAAEPVARVWHSHLFRHLCPVTGQPDWASIVIDYAGPKLEAGALLHYLVSFRQHQGFHEAMVERLYTDLLEACGPERLSVQGLFLRRGGIGICPFRSSSATPAPRLRTARQ